MRLSDKKSITLRVSCVALLVAVALIAVDSCTTSRYLNADIRTIDSNEGGKLKSVVIELK